MKKIKKEASDSQNTNGFRLLGILTGKRPTAKEIKLGCKDYFKVLKENTYYPFYSCFSYKNDNGVQTLTYHPEKDIDLYSTDSDTQTGQKHPSIHISAIVGKNGTGKSTLLELLYLAAYHIGVAAEVLENSETEEKILFIRSELGFDFQFFFQDEKNTISHLRFFENTLKPRIRRYELAQNKSEIKLDQLFEIPYSERSDDRDYFTTNELDEKSLKVLFYSVAINYSIYGLNAENIGFWINHLFHKNDGYQTPLVINPKRQEGDININLEKELAIARFLVNMIENNLQSPINEKSDNKYWITDKQYVNQLIFRLEDDKLEYISHYGDEPCSFEEFYALNDGRDTFINKLYIELIEENHETVKKKNTQFLTELEDYLVKKLLKITLVYPQQFGRFTQQIKEVRLLDNKMEINKIKYCFISNLLSEFFEAVKKDQTHITLKIRQTINYLKHPTLFETKNIQWEEKRSYFKDDEEIIFSEFKMTMDLQEFANRLNAIERDGLPLIEFIPPALFQPDMILGPSENRLKIMFSHLSSGEQQQIHSVQSILYHLRNIDSVHEKNKNSTIKNEDDQRTAFKNVNLILDEIELYAHPEMQRKFIDDLIKGIRRLKLEHIEGINILLATHSPFILSDIPAQNILRLKLNNAGKSEPEPMKDQTFGANIHDLLANDFFLKDGFMGEFAKEKIQDVILFLTYDENEKQSDVNKRSKRNWTKSESEQLINLIGEDVLRNSLLSLHRKRFDEPSYSELLDFYNRWSHDANK